MEKIAANIMEKEREKVEETLRNVRHKIAIISGKGGVGKSMVATMLSLSLATKYKGLVGLLDADITGPSIPKMLGIEGERPEVYDNMISPIFTKHGIKVVSIDFFLESKETPVIWRGPLKSRAIIQFLSQVEWGELEYLIIDLPPGTGDEALTVAQTMNKIIDGAIIVTIPSMVSKMVVKKAVSFCRELGIPVIGIIENMSGVLCPNCGTFIEIFPGRAGEEIAEESKVKFLGKIPIDPKLSSALDRGENYLKENSNSRTAKALEEIVKRIEETVNK